MARYRHKDEYDLIWNGIRDRITLEANYATKRVRERILNDALSKAWEEFSTAIGEGKVPEVEARYGKFVTEIVEDQIPKIRAAVDVESPVD